MAWSQGPRQQASVPEKIQSPEQQVTEEVRGSLQEPSKKGVWGSLLVFLVILGLITLSRAIVTGAVFLNPEWPKIAWLMWCWVFLAILGIVCVTLGLLKNRFFRTLTVAWVIINFALRFLAPLQVGYVAMLQDVSLLFSIVALVYLFKSKRVQETYFT